MIAEHGIVQNYLLEQFDQFVGEVGRHECFHSYRNIIGILSFG